MRCGVAPSIPGAFPTSRSAVRMLHLWQMRQAPFPSSAKYRSSMSSG
jgi:hypothetical protein